MLGNEMHGDKSVNWKMKDAENVMKRWSFFELLSQRLNDVLILLMLVAAVVIFQSGLLYLINTGWGLYKFTAMGEQYLNRYGPPDLILFIDSIDITVLTIKTTFIILCINLVTAFLSRFLGLSSHLYINTALPMRIFLWGLPVAWLGAVILQQSGMTRTFSNSFFLTVFPSIVLMNHSFRFAQSIVPEFELLLTAYPRLSQLWDGLSRCLSLIFVSTVFSVMVLYLLLGLSESGFQLSRLPPFQIVSPSWGSIPLDLTPRELVEVAFLISLTVFCVCAIPAAFAQLLHAIKGFYLPLSGPVKFLLCGPLFLLASAQGIRCFNHIEPFAGALILAVVPTFSIYHALLSQLPGMIPEMGELVCKMDSRIKHPVDLSDVFKWLGRKGS